MHRHNKTLLAVLLLFFVACSSQVLDQKTLALTIYNDNFGLVKDTRTMSFEAGSSQVFFTDVASTIETETVMFKAVDPNTSIRVLEQNFENNLASKEAVLKKYINQEVRVVVEQGKSAATIKGTLLAYSPTYIIETPFGLEMFDRVQSISVAKLPEGLLTQPTLVWKAYAPKQVTADFEVSYRATGFSWKADYVAVLNKDESAIDFSGWVTIDNNSGKRYKDALLKLIAGDVNIVKPTPVYQFAKLNAAPMAAMSMDMGAPSFNEKSFADYHMYTLDRRVDVSENQRKQIEFIPTAKGVQVDKFYLVSINAGGNPETNIKAQSQIRFLNAEKYKLGLPLPKGTIRVFKEDDDKSLEFIGEDSIQHTPRDENVTLKTGNAFDLVTKKTIVSRTNMNNGYDASVKLEVTNRGVKAAKIKMEFNNYYGDNLKLVLKNKNQPQLTRVDGNKYEALFSVAKDATVTIEWDEFYRY